jgi:hypothetical protein
LDRIPFRTDVARRVVGPGSSPGTSLARITVVEDDRRKRIDQADLLVDTGQQQHAAIETEQTSVESGGNLLLAGMMAKAYRRR